MSEPRIVSCDICISKFKNMQDLNKHMEVRHQETPHIQSNEDTDEEIDEDDGEIKEKLFDDRYYGGEHKDIPSGASLKYLKGKKGDFLNAFNKLKDIMVPGTKHTIDGKTFTVKSEHIDRGKSTFGVEIKVKNKVGETNIVFHGPNKGNECSIQVKNKES